MDYSQTNNSRRKRKQRSQIPRVKNKIGVLLFRAVAAVVLIGGFAAAGAAFGLYMGIIREAPVLKFANVQSGNFTSFILSDKTGEEIERLSGAYNRVFVSIENMPENLTNAFVAIEDERFYTHNGVDLRGMARAVVNRVMGGSTQGASTITQQLIKNILGRYDGDLIFKLQEQYLAVQFEKRLAEPDMMGSVEAAKDYILEAYMNEINLGRGYYGVQSAAWNYFGKDVSELTLSECAVIAAITQNPSRFPPDLHPDSNRIRQEYVLENMKRLGFITEAEYDEAWDDNVYDRVLQGVKKLDGSGVVYSYYNDAVINAVVADLQEQYSITASEASNWVFNKGLQIYTPQDMEMQRIVDEVYINPENFPQADFEIDVLYIMSVKNNITGKITNFEKKATVKNEDEAALFVQSVHDELLTANDDILADQLLLTDQPQSGFIIMDYHTGHVLAVCGGRGEKTVNRSFNRATSATRSPGSQFKVVAGYAPALDLGRITAATVIDDSPFLYDDGSSEPYMPHNWYGRNTYEGLSTVRRGIYRSMNVVTVKTMMANGINISFQYLLNFGFSTLVEGEWRNNRWLTDQVVSLPLGGLTDGVTLVDLCAAYGTIANGGEYNRPIFYTKVLDHNGNILLENTQEPRQVLKKTTAYVLTDMMRDVVRVGTGYNARFREISMPIAGKTGTSTDTKDLGFTGYTPYYVAAVWMGYDQQKTIREEQDSGGNSYHLRIWRLIMEEIHRDLPERDFERPDGIVTASVCRDSGMIPTDLCQRDPRGSRVYREIFISGTQPTEACAVHQELQICTVSGMRAGPNCPADVVQMRVGIVRPIPCEDEDIILQDRQYELTPEMLEGPACTVHEVPEITYPWDLLPGDWGWPGFYDPLIPPPKPVIPPPDYPPAYTPPEDTVPPEAYTPPEEYIPPEAYTPPETEWPQIPSG